MTVPLLEWLHRESQHLWLRCESPEDIAENIRLLLSSEEIAHQPRGPQLFSELQSSGSRSERDAELKAARDRCSPNSCPADVCIGLPQRLWERLLDHLEQSQVRGTRTWLSDEEDASFHQGVTRGRWTSWWGCTEALGAVYDDQLWAWGAVHESLSSREDDLSHWTPRLAWTSDDASWSSHSVLERAVYSLEKDVDTPRIEDGPGHLLACILDAVLELTNRDHSFTRRDLAVIWGVALLPLLAPTQRLSDVPRFDALSEERVSDYMMMVPFYLLHPRIQLAVTVLDHLCTLLIIESQQSLWEILFHLGRPVPQRWESVAEGTHLLIQDLARQIFHRQAGKKWDSGFGFRMFRRILRSALQGGPEAFETSWDNQIHGKAAGDPASVGAFAERLREAMGTAMWYPGRPKYNDGPAAQQLLDLIWLRWTDDLFLPDVVADDERLLENPS